MSGDYDLIVSVKMSSTSENGRSMDVVSIHEFRGEEAVIEMDHKPKEIVVEYETQKLCFDSGRISQVKISETTSFIGDRPLDREDHAFHVSLEKKERTFVCKVSRKQD